jgi:hypothetical protein
MQVHALVVTPLAGLPLRGAKTHFTPVNTHFLNATIDRLWFEVLAMDESLLSTFRDPNSGEHSHIVGCMLVGFVSAQQQRAFL